MDVFKLLSGSAAALERPSSYRIPSSGAAANPQLFGQHEDKVATGNLNTAKKRKRVLETACQSTRVSVDLDVPGRCGRVADSLRTAEPGLVDESSTRKGNTHDAVAQDGLESTASNEGDVNEPDRKRILRSHKIKITVLEHSLDPQQETTLGRKSWEMKKPAPHKMLRTHSKGTKIKAPLFPRPLTSFAELSTHYGLARRLAQNVQARGYHAPTEVQIGALPLLLDSQYHPFHGQGGTGALCGDKISKDYPKIDLLAVAPTGSGKTMTFLIPIVNALMVENNGYTDGIRALIVAPTRELAGQIVNEARKLAHGTGIRATLMKKGMEVVSRKGAQNFDQSPEDCRQRGDEDSDSGASQASGTEAKRQRRLAEVVKAAILVSTPLALLHALKHADGGTLPLQSVQYLVLDEADVLLDPLFREQTLAVWNACTRPDLRISLWSATMGSNVESISTEQLVKRHCISAFAGAPLVRLVVGLKDTALPTITHRLIYAATESGKLLGLRQILHPATATFSSDSSPTVRPPILVFTQTIPRAVALHSELLYDIPSEAGGRRRLAVLHADLPTASRDNIMARFRSGEIWVLITTDLLARGVDFRGLNGVVNYDMPTSAAAYVHRVGRTGRAGRAGGVAVTFYTEEDIPHAKAVANVIYASEKLRGTGDGHGEIKPWLLKSLPTPSKRDRQRIKQRGVEARRTDKGGDGRAKNKVRISSKSGYERRLENNKKGAVLASRKRKLQERSARLRAERAESEFGGFSD